MSHSENIQEQKNLQRHSSKRRARVGEIQNIMDRYNPKRSSPISHEEYMRQVEQIVQNKNSERSVNQTDNAANTCICYLFGCIGLFIFLSIII